MDFAANLMRFQQCKNCENRLRFDKVTESLKVGTFLRHSILLRQTASCLVLLCIGYLLVLIRFSECSKILQRRSTVAVHVVQINVQNE